MTTAFPAEVALLLGDIAHNLRTSLDHLACELVRHNKGNADDVYFPICKEGEYLDTQIKKKKFDRAGPEAVKLLKTTKPYRGGNVMLRGLHELDNMDKHRLIVPVVARGLIRKATLEFPGGGNLTIKDGMFFDNAIDFGCPPGTSVMDSTIEPIFEFAHSTPDPFRGRVVLDALQDALKMTLGIIEAFELLSFGSAVRPATA